MVDVQRARNAAGTGDLSVRESGEDVVLATEALSKSFGGFSAVSDVTLQFRRGSIHALIGPNGAGKTTFFNLLTKFLTPTSGRILYNGSDITALSPAKIAQRGLVRSFQISAVFPTLTVIENVRVALQRNNASVLDFWRTDRVLRALDEQALRLVEDVGLADQAFIEARELSYGRKRALEIATTLALNPQVMLLDEPMAGMGVEDIDRTSDLIRAAAASRTIVMVEHNLSVVASLCDRITVLARGTVLADGDYRTVSTDPAVIEAYIGTGHD
jgi:branched-chain amino acid transport system ATP-binding protein